MRLQQYIFGYFVFHFLRSFVSSLKKVWLAFHCLSQHLIWEYRKIAERWFREFSSWRLFFFLSTQQNVQILESFLLENNWGCHITEIKQGGMGGDAQGGKAVSLGIGKHRVMNGEQHLVILSKIANCQNIFTSSKVPEYLLCPEFEVSLQKSPIIFVFAKKD